MNNPNDNLKAQKNNFGTIRPSDTHFGDPDNPNKDIIINAEAEAKNQLGQLSKQVQNKGQFIEEKIFDSKTLMGSSANQNVLPSLSQAIIALIIILIVTLFLSPLFSDGLPDYWISLPLQAYWSYWLFAINRALAKRYNCITPISLIELILVCSLNYAFLPLMTNYHAIMLLDPFFYLWLATLVYAPFKFGKFIGKQAKDKQRMGIQLSLWSTAFCSVGALVLLILPHGTHGRLLFSLCWFLSQSAWITYFILLLSGKTNAKAQLIHKETQVYDGSNIVIRHRAYPELERWYKQKFGAKGLTKGTRLILMWFGGPVVVILAVTFMSGWLSSLYANAGAHTIDAAAAAGNIRFIYQFILGLILITIGALGAFFVKPTHLGLGEKGMRFLWRRKFFSRNGNYIPWSGMTNIYIEQRSNQTSANAAKLCFRDNNNRIKRFSLNAFDSYEDKQLLLNAIRTWAPTISRDARVIESLQPPSDYSYTELWLQALSAPPKRERFKPLIKGAVLKNERYKVLSSLGAGGQGFAYLVEDCSNGQEVVLKEFILPVYVDISIRKSALKQFENEARILSQLQHPQIVRLLDFFVEDHRAYLVLEHIDGASIRTIVERSGPLSEENTRALANQMCDILSYLHSQIPPVVHRDFTPDNLILNTNGTLKLIDFNVAQNTESTTTGTVVGKPAYLPPEQFRGTPTTQSDIYAMGATLYFLLTGCDPTPISVSHPAQNNPEISLSLDNIIARATDIDINNRYPDIAALKEDLVNIV